MKTNVVINPQPHAFITGHAVGSSNEFTNMPAAVTEFLASANGTRSYADLSPFRQARIMCRAAAVAPVANAKMLYQYSTDQNTWTTICSVTMPATANTTNVGTWTAIPTAALTSVYIRVAGSDGDGIVDPTFGYIMMELR